VIERTVLDNNVNPARKLASLDSSRPSETRIASSKAMMGRVKVDAPKSLANAAEGEILNVAKISTNSARHKSHDGSKRRPGMKPGSPYALL
jgi:hypothetical protein